MAPDTKTFWCDVRGVTSACGRSSHSSLLAALGLQSYEPQLLLSGYVLKPSSQQNPEWRPAAAQRHEEPKQATDEYEIGTYVYFDFNIVHDGTQSGWCYRLKQVPSHVVPYLDRFKAGCEGGLRMSPT